MLSLSASTLLQAGCAIPQSFVKIMGNEALLINYHSTPQETSIVGIVIGDMALAFAGMTGSSRSRSTKHYSRCWLWCS